jgi:hypothetical protein
LNVAAGANIFRFDPRPDGRSNAARTRFDQEVDRMSSVDAALLSDIAMTHERLISAMEGRLPNLPLETKERYFAVLSLLVAKLEIPEKPLGEILREMVAEAATHLLQEMGR